MFVGREGIVWMFPSSSLPPFLSLVPSLNPLSPFISFYLVLLSQPLLEIVEI